MGDIRIVQEGFVKKEEMAEESFWKKIIKAGQYFVEDPVKTPFIPSGNRVSSAFPEILKEITKAVEADMQEYQP